MFMEHCVADVEFSFRVLTNNGPQFVSKHFATIYRELAVSTVITTEKQAPPSEHAEHLKVSMSLTLRHLGAEC